MVAHAASFLLLLSKAQAAMSEAEKTAILEKHNTYRCMHNVPLFTWVDAIADTAQAVANKGVWAHSAHSERTVAGENCGENLAAGTPGFITVESATAAWYDEIELTDGTPANNDDFTATKDTDMIGHYTQVVWKDSIKMGCASAKLTENNHDFIVCHYCPWGNIQGQYAANVLAPSKTSAECSPNACTATADCNGHGTTSDADKTDGCTCSCSPGYTGTDCSQETCDDTAHCSGHGTTTDNDATDGCVCQCADGFSGDDCSTNLNACTASADCNGHGTTSDEDKRDGCTCSCSPGYTGTDCSEEICDDTVHCSGHGNTTDADATDGCTCQCADGFSGDDCSTGITTLYDTISKVCLRNHAGFFIRFAVMRSDGTNKTNATGWFSMPFKGCLELKDIPTIKSGDTVKTEVMLAGNNSFLEGIKYSPTGTELTYTCRGAIWDFACTPDQLPPADAETVCVTNQAWFLMHFTLQDTSSGGETSDRTDRYANTEQRCISLKDIKGIADGAEAVVSIQPTLGKKKDLVDQLVTYKKGSGLQVDYFCRGSTMNYYCERGDAGNLSQSAKGGGWLTPIDGAPHSVKLQCALLLALASLALGLA